MTSVSFSKKMSGMTQVLGTCTFLTNLGNLVQFGSENSSLSLDRMPLVGAGWGWQRSREGCEALVEPGAVIENLPHQGLGIMGRDFPSSQPSREMQRTAWVSSTYPLCAVTMANIPRAKENR